MDTRRDFVKKAMLLTGAAVLSGLIPESIQRALAINPEVGSTYLDAEHVVILMQENRSFDHCFGTLKGVRGFNDPRAITLPDKNLVWAQSNAAGKTYAPFRLNIKDSKITWMGALPHGRQDQADAFNFGKFNQWLDAKISRINKQYVDIPTTMGYYTREDIPFNYALADAFTICDQNFCSAMTSTYPNRSYLWTGTIRGQQENEAKAHIYNWDFKYGRTKWKTFPERLEENNISWKVYQNDIYCGGGFEGEERGLLSNLGCNPLEYFESYNVKFTPRYVAGFQKQTETLPKEIQDLKSIIQDLSTNETARSKAIKSLQAKEKALSTAKEEVERWSMDNYNKLSAKEKSLHQRAFTNNSGDPDYHTITPLSYLDGTVKRQINAPKGDILYQFRKDTTEGNLPVVSWLVAPAMFSDHPGCPWYGSWYVSEILNILTQNPEVWKKTIFILTYDENDGYFDHIPPFVASDPKDPESGKVSSGIDTGVEYIRFKNEVKGASLKDTDPGGPIGLGFRVPMIVASPWSRGGQVCSQVFDHTSSLQFLEKFLSEKLSRDIKEPNISSWRRAISGDLTSVFNPYRGNDAPQLSFLKRDPHIEKIYNASFKPLPAGFKQLAKGDIEQLNRNPESSSFMPRQEPGIRSSCALPYQLYAEGKLSNDKKSFEVKMEARNEIFGKQSAGSPFNIYTLENYLPDTEKSIQSGNADFRSYAVAAGDSLTDAWLIERFENKHYHLRIYGPNGFFREFTGKTDDPFVEISCDYEHNATDKGKLTGNLLLKLMNQNHNRQYTIEIRDNAYKKEVTKKLLFPSGSKKGAASIIFDLSKSYGWYDFSIRVKGFDTFEKRYAGRIETGKPSYSDPAMG